VDDYDEIDAICTVVKSKLGGVDGSLFLHTGAANGPQALFGIKDWRDISRIHRLNYVSVADHLEIRFVWVCTILKLVDKWPMILTKIGSFKHPSSPPMP